MKKYTIKDVAKEAGVSITTVSHVLKKTRFVEKVTEEKVMKAVKKLNYTISLNASSLRGKKTKMIGLIIPDVSNPIFAELSRNIEDLFYKKGYSLALCNSEGNLEREINYTNVLRSRNADGIIVVPTSNKYCHLQEITNQGITLIVIERDVEGLEADNIVVDGFNGYFEATQYLINLGHKKIGFIRRPYDLSHSLKRFEGYTKALEDNKVRFNIKYCPISLDFSYKGGYKAMNEIMDLKNPPTAIFTFDDIAGIGAMKAVLEKGLSVPKDFSFIGFDDIPIDEYLPISLSSITFPTEKIADEALNIFINREKDKDIEKKKVLIQPKLIIRDSVYKIIDSG